MSDLHAFRHDRRHEAWRWMQPQVDDVLEPPPRLREVFGLAEQMLAQAPNLDALCFAVGLLLGARHNLVTLDAWQEWGVLASKLLYVLAQTVMAPNAAAAPPDALAGEEDA